MNVGKDVSSVRWWPLGKRTFRRTIHFVHGDRRTRTILVDHVVRGVATVAGDFAHKHDIMNSGVCNISANTS